MTTFSEKKKFVLESGLTFPELKQIISELHEDAAQAEADGITVYKLLGVSEPDPEEGYNRVVDVMERGIAEAERMCGDD